MGIEIVQITMALALMVINVLVFVDRRDGMKIATRGARGFAVAAFASAVVALLTINQLMMQVWIHPADETAFVVFRLSMTAMGLTTSGAVAFWVLSRWEV
ncbi:hypothetical protein GCM10009552_18490 [Rothia nasimurium]|uniref:Uncharacterized protein n=1 Tax=Luteibacter anthropi TaxID=564369 RepID=A0A7X5ZKA6_9GAMM|nr:hypothetical protein [Luteibacter anthropi]NII08883.1 hypothetical protein [Luteibacter anthropi]